MANSSNSFERSIELRDVTVQSNGRVILNIPHALIPADRITACIGPNGAGKTTLLKLLDGLIKPDTGTVSFSFTRKTALVLHHTPLIKASTKTNLAIVRDADSSITEADIDKVIRQVGLGQLQDSPAHKLSAGERQKLCLARAILQRPNLVLLDEPTANLDPNATEQVEDMIRQFNHQGSDVIFSSHQLAQVQRLAQHIIFIDQGEIKEKGPVGPFFSDPQTQAAKRFLHQELLNG
ncbi:MULTISPECIES: ATP-binding cassette domain-containing protein [unclassified Polynucleobacter]|jgi:tungstate transport system ATP-binding protein|uniref:ATP-binding cassette domain-containing protein n=1 Tax=unclassified Polynucleobacter TaxID=2640945 RepID=UPI001BFE2F86|nr:MULTISPECIES: ATP-binding cassette domain-containing protein [unclassified Polynucleobacter]MBU3606363.1 ATP-binding cassette domain-containing protein [Polynucleobacter sp. MWH-Creno-3A4]QWD78519.1 ATP-binding cassette domain-containing protein [Polynucleobacter sp. MWH-Svant-W18]